jgi:hypothetical protein
MYFGASACVLSLMLFLFLKSADNLGSGLSLFLGYPELNLNLNTAPNVNLKSQEPGNICAQLQTKIIKLWPAELVVYAGCKVIWVN